MLLYVAGAVGCGLVRCDELAVWCGLGIWLGVEWFPIVQTDDYALAESISSECIAGVGALVICARVAVLPVEPEGLQRGIRLSGG